MNITQQRQKLVKIRKLHEGGSISDSEYSRVHYWLRKNFGKASVCESTECKKNCSTFVWAKKTGKKYECIRDNFLQLCPSCHTKYDFNDRWKENLRKNNPRSKKKFCSKGHKLSAKNVCINPKFPLRRICRQCHRLSGKKYAVKNIEKISEKNKKRYRKIKLKNPDFYKELGRKYRENNRETINKNGMKNYYKRKLIASSNL